MPANSLETSSRGGEETGRRRNSEVALPAAQASGGLKPWLPLIVAVLTMPLLAFATTRFVLHPQNREDHHRQGQIRRLHPRQPRSLRPPRSRRKRQNRWPGKAKATVPLTKILVNVAGTMGTRYLMTSVTLVGKTPDFKTKIEDNKDQLMDLATGVLSSKTISDLEKPGARNEIRAELLNCAQQRLRRLRWCRRFTSPKWPSNKPICHESRRPNPESARADSKCGSREPPGQCCGAEGRRRTQRAQTAAASR